MLVKTKSDEDGKSSSQNKTAPEFVPTKIAAEFLGISENALRIKVCRGQIPTYKFGRSLRFRLTEIASLFVKRD